MLRPFPTCALLPAIAHYDRPQLWRPPTFVCMLLAYSNEITFAVVRWNGNDTVSR